MKKIAILALAMTATTMLLFGCGLSGQQVKKKEAKETFEHKDDYYEISNPCDLEGDERDDSPAHIGGSSDDLESNGGLSGFSYTSRDGRTWKESPDGHGIMSNDGYSIYDRPDGSRELSDGKGNWAQDTDKDGVYDKFGHE